MYNPNKIIDNLNNENSEYPFSVTIRTGGGSRIDSINKMREIIFASVGEFGRDNVRVDHMRDFDWTLTLFFKNQKDAVKAKLMF